MQTRIKGSRLYKLEKANRERLYIPIGKSNRDMKTTAYFEIVNDRLVPFVKVENYRSHNLYDTEKANYYKAYIEKQFREIINDCELERKKVPLHERLKDNIIPVHENSLKHQADALRFCCTMKVTAMFADTGTGKSKIVIDLCNSRYEAGQINKVIVFLPVSTKKNFKKEVEKWTESNLIWHYVGIESMGSSDRVFLETLDLVHNETQIIVDESHMIKNPIAKRSKRIKKVCDKASYKVVMTGTPVTENVHNLYMQYAMLSDLIIGVNNWLKFEEKYLIMGGINGDEVIGYKNINELMGLLEPYTYQISKEECLQLPAVKHQTYYCQFTELQAEYYQREKDKLLQIIEFDDIRATDIFEVFTRMQQIASGYYKYKDNEPIILDTYKLSLFDKIDLSKKTIFFCKYLFEIQVICNHFGFDKCSVFTGNNPKERDDELQRFVEGSKTYFVATMQSGGTGLNGLQTASCQAVFFSNSFSYFQRKQSIGRIDRQGQINTMTVIDLLTDSGIDNRIMSNLRRKGNLADEIKGLLKDKTKLKQYINEM